MHKNKIRIWYIAIYATLAVFIVILWIFLFVRLLKGQADWNLVIDTGLATVFLMILSFIVRALFFRQKQKELQHEVQDGEKL